MPKLAAKVRKKVAVAKAVTGGFEPLKPGKYVAILDEVEATTAGTGAPMWRCVFSEITALDGEVQPGRQWYNLMLPQDTMPEDYTPKKSKKAPEEAWADYQNLCNGRIKGFFEAFGFTVDSDTDEMIGERVVLQIGVRTIQSGVRKGEPTNDVNGVFPLDSVDLDEVGEGGGGKDEDAF